MTAETVGTSEEIDSVAHLFALGYTDPADAAVRLAARERAERQLLAQAEERLKAGELAEATALLESAESGDADWTAPRHLLARVYFRMGQFDKAAECLAWLECRGVEHAELSLLRAQLLWRRRDLDQAVEEAAYAKCLHDPLPQADLLLAEMALRRGELDSAEAGFERVRTAMPENAAALAGLAAVALRRGEFEAAVDWALQSLDLDMRAAAVHFRLGIALAKLGRTREAIVALQTAAACNPRVAGPYWWLERLARSDGELDAAARFRALGREVVQRRRAARARTAWPSG
jgi:tetratricopeptide (TPR) repeat protein